MASKRKKQPLPAPRRPQDWDHLKQELDGLLSSIDWDHHRDEDPVSIVWGYERDEDREVVALIAACLAYGRVSLLKAAINKALVPLGESPAATLKALDKEGAAGLLDGFVYRMTRGEDLESLYVAIGEALRQFGSLGSLFKSGYTASDIDFQPALTGFVSHLRAYGDCDRRGFKYLLADPSTGGATKRLNLFLRWMVRGPDAVDLGLWSALPSSKLAMPLDTHILRIARYLGLCTRQTVDWKLAREITTNLARLDGSDPLKYDFALCHLGISGACPSKRDPVCCAKCPILAVCLL